MNEEQQSESSPEKKPAQNNPEPRAEGVAGESTRKRQTIPIKLPRKPAAPRAVGTVYRPAAVPALNPAEPAKAHDSPLRITCFVIMALLALAYCSFFFEFIRGVPLRDYLPTILWPKVVHKLLGIALIVGFALFERTHKELSVRSRWCYCVLLGFATAFFGVQLIIRF